MANTIHIRHINFSMYGVAQEFIFLVCHSWDCTKRVSIHIMQVFLIVLGWKTDFATLDGGQ